MQARVIRLSLVRRIFNAAAVGISGVAAALAHEQLTGTRPPYTVSALVESPRSIGALAMAALVYCTLNRHLVAGIIGRVAPGTPRRQLTGSRADAGTDLTEMCTGILVATVASANAALTLVAIPPVLLLQRSLLHAELVHAATTDAKTHVANPAYWRNVAERTLARALRAGHPLAVLAVDIDYFKAVNDTHGHVAADTALIAIAGCLTAATRPTDLVGRYGGDEFLVLLPDTTRTKAAHIAERIRHDIAALPPVTSPGRPPTPVTASLGVAALNPTTQELPALLTSADGAAYQAKASGRNRVHVAGLDGHQPPPLTVAGTGWQLSTVLAHPEACGQPPLRRLLLRVAGRRVDHRSHSPRSTGHTLRGRQITRRARSSSAVASVL